MITRFKSALNRIEADQELVKRTESYLQDALRPGQQAIRRNRESRSPWLFFPDWSSMRSLAAVACVAIFMIAGSTGAYTYLPDPRILYLRGYQPQCRTGHQCLRPGGLGAGL